MKQTIGLGSGFILGFLRITGWPGSCFLTQGFCLFGLSVVISSLYLITRRTELEEMEVRWRIISDSFMNALSAFLLSWIFFYNLMF